MNQKFANFWYNSRFSFDGNEYSVEIHNDYENEEGSVGNIFAATLHKGKSGEKLPVIMKQQKTGEDPVYTIVKEMFENEANFYKHIWKKMINFSKSVCVIPECIGILEADQITIVLEDVTVQGFVLYDKLKCFDEEHFCLISKTYGVFHGLSMIFRYQNPNEYFEFENLLHPLFKDSFDESGYFSEKFSSVLRLIQHYFDEDTEGHILEKLHSYIKSGSKLVHVVLSQDVEQDVILHGDCWSNNMMFKYGVS